ncbi:MAG: hypothetical protein HW411_97 [Gammaproteobacteria bacterium]|nr:hypothetical protein [Gammaproteobacteria bacterium]
MIPNNIYKKCLLTLLFFSIISNAHAYIDPGTGSLLIQGLLAAIAGAMVTIKIYWHRILTFFGRKRDREKENQENMNSKEE